MADSNTPNQNANKSKAEGDRWGAEQTSAPQAEDRNEIAGNYAEDDGDSELDLEERRSDR